MLSSHQGKVLRIKEDGSIPKENPFFGNATSLPEIWSFGHRSPQGLAMRPGTEDLWLAEMGPRGGDEVNLIQKGENYGWPEATYGSEYYGPKIGQKSKAGMKEPIAYWVPSISPSALAFYSGEKFPHWKGNIFLANLSGSHIRRLVLKGNEVVKQEALLEDMVRFRNLRTGPDGFLYLSTDDGLIGRLVP
jgi:glucose/arabinose dehydrogenase